MPQILEVDRWLVVARAAHFGACLVLFGIFAFDRFVADPVLGSQRRDWNRIARALVIAAVACVILSGVLWFVRLAIDIDGASVSIAEVMRILWTRTHFGAVWRMRLIIAIAALVPIAVVLRGDMESQARTFATWIALLLSGLLIISLAWAGHGETGRAPGLHLIADALHLFAAGLWPTGLLPFLLLLIKLRAEPQVQRWPLIAAMTARFSLLSIAAVSLLATTGILNSWCLVGSLADLISTVYGRVLLVKMVLFCIMIAIGAVNLLILKPRLTSLIEDSNSHLDKASAQLQWQVFAEAVLGGMVLIIVAILGLLPPALE